MSETAATKVFSFNRALRGGIGVLLCKEIGTTECIRVGFSSLLLTSHVPCSSISSPAFPYDGGGAGDLLQGLRTSDGRAGGVFELALAGSGGGLNIAFFLGLKDVVSGCHLVPGIRASGSNFR